MLASTKHTIVLKGQRSESRETITKRSDGWDTHVEGLRRHYGYHNQKNQDVRNAAKALRVAVAADPVLAERFSLELSALLTALKP